MPHIVRPPGLIRSMIARAFRNPTLDRMSQYTSRRRCHTAQQFGSPTRHLMQQQGHCTPSLCACLVVFDLKRLELEAARAATPCDALHPCKELAAIPDTAQLQKGAPVEAMREPQKDGGPRAATEGRGASGGKEQADCKPSILQPDTPLR